MTARRKPLHAALAVDLGPAFDGWSGPPIVGIGLDGSVYAAARRSSEDLADCKILRLQGGARQTVVLRKEGLAASFVQPFRDGVLLVGARCCWTRRGPEKNALAVDWRGRELARFTVGDGIADVRVTPRGRIWVSYFDEGVFGNYGWNDPGPAPIGAAGLVRFSRSGKASFEYDFHSAATGDICDMYAMNVAAENEAWLYFYTEFPIVRVRDGDYRAWKLGIGGARALAVRDDRVLLLGDYERSDLVRLIELGRGKTVKVVEERLLRSEDGTPLERAQPWAVGSALYVLQDRKVFVVREW